MIWEPLLDGFAQAHHCIALDLRGCGGSFKPTAVQDYHLTRLAEDIADVAQAVSPDRPVALVGHDFGASVAYASAEALGAAVDVLVAINGPHPDAIQRAVLADAGQAEASQYLAFFQRPDAQEILASKGYKALLDVYVSVLGKAHIPHQMRDRLIEAWSAPGAVEGMMNWYRANRVHVPVNGLLEGVTSEVATRPKFGRVRHPHLVIWGEQDPFLNPACHLHLDDLCDDLTKIRVSDAGHSILATHGPAVTGHVLDFIEERRAG